MYCSQNEGIKQAEVKIGAWSSQLNARWSRKSLPGFLAFEAEAAFAFLGPAFFPDAGLETLPALVPVFFALDFLGVFLLPVVDFLGLAADAGFFAFEGVFLAFLGLAAAAGAAASPSWICKQEIKHSHFKR